ncbi:MAG: TrkA family potassium uptake protein [Oscillospiraceae bacterium]|nr:TrkA family potassium uptake protein [Oscillospiraceae bacterium]
MGSFLVIGMGRFGSSLAVELHQLKHEVLVLNKREEDIAAVINQVTDVVIGDAKDEAVLRSLGIPNFDSVIVCMADAIEDSILTTMTLKDLGAKSIICKAQNERHAKILYQIGAEKVIRPEYDMGKRVASSLARRNIKDYLEISPEHGVMEILTPSHWAGKSIMKSNLRRKHGVTIMAIRDRKTDKIVFSPDADAVLHEGDTLTMIGSKKDLDAISAMK